MKPAAMAPAAAAIARACGACDSIASTAATDDGSHLSAALLGDSCAHPSADWDSAASNSIHEEENENEVEVGPEDLAPPTAKASAPPPAPPTSPKTFPKACPPTRTTSVRELTPSGTQQDNEEELLQNRLLRMRSSPARLGRGERTAAAAESIPMDRSFLFAVREEDSVFRKTTVSVPKDFSPGSTNVSVTVDGKTWDIEAPKNVRPGDKMVVYLPKALPLSADAKQHILQEVRRPMLYSTDALSPRPRAGSDRAASPPRTAVETAPCDDNMRLRLLQYKALQGRSMEPGVRTISEADLHNGRGESMDSSLTIRPPACDGEPAEPRCEDAAEPPRATCGACRMCRALRAVFRYGGEAPARPPAEPERAEPEAG